jgi:hypothetical protein
LDSTNAPGHGDSKYSYNDPILSWSISAVDYDPNKASTYNLGPYMKIINNKIQNLPVYQSGIHEIKIASAQTAGTFTVLDDTKYGIDLNSCLGSIKDFLVNSVTSVSLCKESFKWNNQTIAKPVLKFTVIHALNDISNSSASVPYLEYQLLMIGTIGQPTNAYQTITGESVSGSYKQVLEVKMPQESGILEYVIQQ